jgi:nucleoside-diphosphate-sugar epimerase
MISTDFVYDPQRRRYPQNEADADYLTDGYGGLKRKAEEVLLAAGSLDLPWVVLRPGHIYGPGSLLGCLPPVGRDAQLIDKLRCGAGIPLVGAGRYLQQPIFAPDLARVILELAEASSERCVGGIFNVAGPDVVESVEYYRIVTDALGVELRIDEVPVLEYAREHPDKGSFLCHRFYDLSRLASTGVRLPETPLREGLGVHVAERISAAPG